MSAKRQQHQMMWNWVHSEMKKEQFLSVLHRAFNEICTLVVLCLVLSRNELQIFVGFVLRAADEVELDNKKLNKKS